jgi:hypothetical protein
MPTFKNETNSTIEYMKNGKLIRFDSMKSMGLPFWIPYEQMGLTLVDEVYPPVPNTFLASGTYAFDADVERRFQIAPCEKYLLQVSVTEGRLKLYLGPNLMGVEIEGEYRAVLQWDVAPWLVTVGVGPGSFKIYAEALWGDRNG